MNGGWIGVDLDGSLAHYNGTDTIGDVLPPMLFRVRRWLKQGKQVRIFTARAGDPGQIPKVRAWLSRYGLGELAITNVKDFEMLELWDDRAVQLIPNTGMPIMDPDSEDEPDVEPVVSLAAEIITQTLP